MANIRSFCVFVLLAALSQECLSDPNRSQVLVRQGRCQAAINEIHASEEKFFIEIYRSCFGKAGKRNSPLKGYKLAIMKDNPPRVIVVVDLSDPQLGFGNGETYHVFGYCTDLSFSSNSNISSVQSSLRPKMKLQVGLNYVIALLFNPYLDEFRKIKLTSFQHLYEERNIDMLPQMDRLISANTVDLVLMCLGTTCPAISERLSTFFRSISNDLLIPLPSTAVSLPIDSSLNRCDVISVTSVGQFLNFRYAAPTPGTVNNCNGAAVRSCNGGGSSRESRQPPAPSRLATTDDYLRLLKCELQDGNELGKPSDGFRRPTLTYVRKYQRTVLESAIAPAEDYEACRTSLPSNGQIFDRPWIKSWLKVNHTDGKCNFFCNSCRKFFSLKLRQDIKSFDNFQNEKGFDAKNSVSDNLRAVLSHDKKPTHALAHRFCSDVTERGGSVANGIDAIAIYERAEEAFFKPTMDLMKLQFTEIMAGNSYNDHHLFFKLLQELRVNIGTHHFTNAGSTALVQSMSLSFRKILLQYLVESVMEFSFIVDASTDVSNRGVLACLIQALEGSRPVVYYYRVIELSVGESAQNLFDSIEEQVDNDNYVQSGFSDFFWDKMIGFVTDNAAVMVGKDHSLHQLFSQRASKNVISVGCMAHKLQLSIQRAIKDNESLEYFKLFEKKCNNFYTFYQSWGSKRSIHLQETAEQYDFEYVRLKKFFEVRWASSYYGVVAALKKNFFLMRKDLELMSSDRSLSLSTREGAQDLIDLTCDKSFVIVLHEYLDLLTIFKSLSMSLQTSGGILVGKYQLMQSGIESFRTLKQSPGKELEGFLLSCSCSLCKLGGCTLELFERCRTPRCKDSIFKETADSVGNLAHKRQILYDGFIDKISTYFDLDTLSAFDVFNPFALKSGGDKIDFNNVQAADDKLDKVCEYFKIDVLRGDCFLLRLEYISLLQNLTFHNTEINNIVEPLKFVQMLKEEADQNGRVLALLRSIMVLPAGSSDAERVFSMLNRAKSKERSRLTVNHLDSILRLQFNAPEDILGIDYYFLAREFLLTHIRSDDDDWRGGRPKSNVSINPVAKSTLF